MLRDGTVQRIVNEVCRTLEVSGGVDARAHGRPIETAVWLCMLDCPHGQQLDDPQTLLVGRIRRAVESLLRRNGVGGEWSDDMRVTVERSIRAGLEPPARPSGGIQCQSKS